MLTPRRSFGAERSDAIGGDPRGTGKTDARGRGRTSDQEIRRGSGGNKTEVEDQGRKGQLGLIPRSTMLLSVSLGSAL